MDGWAHSIYIMSRVGGCLDSRPIYTVSRVVRMVGGLRECGWDHSSRIVSRVGEAVVINSRVHIKVKDRLD